MADPTQYSQHPGALGAWHVVKSITARPTQASALVESDCEIKFPEKRTVTTLPDGALKCGRCAGW